MMFYGSKFPFCFADCTYNWKEKRSFCGRGRLVFMPFSWVDGCVKSILLGREEYKNDRNCSLVAGPNQHFTRSTEQSEFSNLQVQIQQAPISASNMSNNYSNKRKLNDQEEEQIMERIRNGDKVKTFVPMIKCFI